MPLFSIPGDIESILIQLVVMMSTEVNIEVVPEWTKWITLLHSWTSTAITIAITCDVITKGPHPRYLHDVWEATPQQLAGSHSNHLMIQPYC